MTRINFCYTFVVVQTVEAEIDTGSDCEWTIGASGNQSHTFPLHRLTRFYVTFFFFLWTLGTTVDIQQ